MKISKNKAFSVIESLLFMSLEPRPLSDFEILFKGELSPQELKALLKELKKSYSQDDRGICLAKTSKGWQLKTKTENKAYLLKIKTKGRFRLSRPSLEVLAIVAFEQPCSKMEIDEIRGMDSGHLLRSLMEKELIRISGRSDLPGRASLYKTSHKFLEVFGMESLKDLPSQEEIEELLTSEASSQDQGLQALPPDLKSSVKIPYQKDEQENKKIKDVLKSLPSTVDFLEKEGKT